MPEKQEAGQAARSECRPAYKDTGRGPLLYLTMQSWCRDPESSKSVRTTFGDAQALLSTFFFLLSIFFFPSFPALVPESRLANRSRNRPVPSDCLDLHGKAYIRYVELMEGGRPVPHGPWRVNQRGLWLGNAGP